MESKAEFFFSWRFRDKNLTLEHLVEVDTYVEKALSRVRK